VRAVLLTGCGGLDKLEYRSDIARPKPKSNEVLVRVRATAINNTDIATRIAWYTPNSSIAPVIDTFKKRAFVFPRIQGAAAAGVIEELGSNVKDRCVGESVVVDPYIRDANLPLDRRTIGFLGNTHDGGYADYLTVPAENALRVRCHLTFAELACLPTAYQTAEEMQIRAGVSSGETVLVTGSSGGVGAGNVQLAKLRGAIVIAVGSLEKADQVRRLGADYFIDRNEDIASATCEICGDRALDVVLDITGGSSVAPMLYSLKYSGRFVCAGAIAGPMTEIDLRVPIYRNLKMFGVGTSETNAMFNLIRYVELGALRPKVSSLFPMANIPEAQTEFTRKKHVGKIIIDVHDAGCPASSPVLARRVP
jgi:NADPH:quinone reductase-like Zn-dependent oxidoreductase